MRIFILSLISFCALLLRAQPPAGYYTSAEGLPGYELKSALSAIITTGHVPQGYDDLWEGYRTTDRDFYYEDDGTILDIYSENPDDDDPYNYTLGTDQCGNYSGEGSCYNREHLMPQSWFNEQSPMKDDIQAVYPTDGYVNGQRGHLPFGEVSSPNYTSSNGSKRGNNIYSFPGAYTGEVFEPIDAFKGDIARVYFYMATRYENVIAGWEDVNDGSQNTLDGTSDQVFEDWMLHMLLAWHQADPVSQKEIDRNNAAYVFQGNRNPFIDHPGYATLIWNPEPDTEAPSAPGNVEANHIIHNSLVLSWEASVDNEAVANYQIEMDGTLIITTALTEYTITGLTPETAYQFVIYAEDTSGNISEGSIPVIVNTTREAVTILLENFDNCPTPSNDFTSVSEMSPLDWGCIENWGENNSNAYRMNAYDGGQVPSIDWLITSEKIDFNAWENERLRFFTSSTYGNTPLELLYSTDYDGGDGPSGFNWLPVPNVNIPLHFQGDDNTTTRELILEDMDVSGIQGKVYLAFRYDTSQGQQATRWTVDSFMLTGEELTTPVIQPVENRVTIWSNPAKNGTIRVQTPYENGFTYTIFDVNGRTLISGQARGNQTAIDVHHLKAGTYVVMIMSDGRRATHKVVILP